MQPTIAHEAAPVRFLCICEGHDRQSKLEPPKTLEHLEYPEKIVAGHAQPRGSSIEHRIEFEAIRIVGIRELPPIPIRFDEGAVAFQNQMLALRENARLPDPGIAIEIGAGERLKLRGHGGLRAKRVPAEQLIAPPKRADFSVLAHSGKQVRRPTRVIGHQSVVACLLKPSRLALTLNLKFAVLHGDR